MRIPRTPAALLALALTAGVGFADPVNISFSRITSNAAQNVEAQFNCAMSPYGSNGVSFTFTNSAAGPNPFIQSSISEIYFQDGPLFSPANNFIINNGTNFTAGASPGNLPAGETVGFHATCDFNSDAVGNPCLGVDGRDLSRHVYADSVTLNIILLPNVTFNDTVAALLDGHLRIGLHVRAIGPNSQSDSFVNDVPENAVVPLPPAVAMSSFGLAGVFGLGCIRRRRR